MLLARVFVELLLTRYVVQGRGGHGHDPERANQSEH